MTRNDWLKYRYSILRTVLCWHTDGFKDYTDFRRHYNKHVIKQKEFGDIPEWQYLWRADSLFGQKSCVANHHGSPNCNVEACGRSHDSADLRYNNRKNELVICQARIIGTFFRPLKPPLSHRAFFLAECLRWLISV